MPGRVLDEDARELMVSDLEAWSERSLRARSERRRNAVIWVAGIGFGLGPVLAFVLLETLR
jgi:hypothetical protein